MQTTIQYIPLKVIKKIANYADDNTIYTVEGNKEDSKLCRRQYNIYRLRQ